MLNILLEAEDSPLSEVLWLMHAGTKDPGVIKRSAFFTTVLLVDRWSLEDFTFNGIWLDVDVKVPLLDFLRVGNHAVKLLDGSNSLWRLLMEALSDVSHDSLVLSDFGGDSDEGAELRREIDVLILLTNFEERLVN